MNFKNVSLRPLLEIEDGSIQKKRIQTDIKELQGIDLTKDFETFWFKYLICIRNSDLMDADRQKLQELVMTFR